MQGYDTIAERDYAGGADVATAADVAASWEDFIELSDTAPQLILDFLAERGLDWRVGAQLGFRWYIRFGRPALAFNAGQGIKVRAVTPDHTRTENIWHREVYPPYMRKEWTGTTIIDRGNDDVAIFESETDMWAVAQHCANLDLAFLPAGASKWSESWAAPLRRYRGVYIATDADAKGDEIANKIALDLPDAKRLRPPDTYKDWCEALLAGAAVSLEDAEPALTLNTPKPPSATTDERFVDLLAEEAQATFGWDLDHPYLHEWVARQTNWPSVAVQERFAPHKSLWECEFTGETIDKLDIPRDELWVVDGVIPTGTITTFAGRSKGGKSRLAMEAARAITKGEKFLGEYQAHACDVLFLCGDDDDRSLQVMFQDWMRAHDIPRQRLTVLMNPELNLLSVPGLKGFRKYLESCAAVPFLVLDSLYNFTPTLDDNERAPVKKVLSDIIRLAQDGLVRGILVIDHAAKGNAGGDAEADAVIGSQAKGGMSRSGINVVKGDPRRGDHGNKTLEDGTEVLETKLVRWGNSGAGWTQTYHHDPVGFTWTKVDEAVADEELRHNAHAALLVAENQTMLLKDLARAIDYPDVSNAHRRDRPFRRALGVRPDLFSVFQGKAGSKTSPWYVSLSKYDQPSF